MNCVALSKRVDDMALSIIRFVRSVQMSDDIRESVRREVSITFGRVDVGIKLTAS